MIELHDKGVDEALERGLHQVVCAWHGKYFGSAFVMREGAQPASHSICERCKEIFNRSNSNPQKEKHQPC